MIELDNNVRKLPYMLHLNINILYSQNKNHFLHFPEKKNGGFNISIMYLNIIF